MKERDGIGWQECSITSYSPKPTTQLFCEEYWIGKVLIISRNFPKTNAALESRNKRGKSLAVVIKVLVRCSCLSPKFLRLAPFTTDFL